MGSTPLPPFAVNNKAVFNKPFCHIGQYLLSYLIHIWVTFPRTGKMVEMWHFFIFLELCCDQTVLFFIFSQLFWRDFVRCKKKLFLAPAVEAAVFCKKNTYFDQLFLPQPISWFTDAYRGSPPWTIFPTSREHRNIVQCTNQTTQPTTHHPSKGGFWLLSALFLLQSADKECGFGLISAFFLLQGAGD